VAAQALLEHVQPQLNLELGDITMFVIDAPPDVPLQYAPVVIAQKSQAQQSPASFDRTIGVCQLFENPIRDYPGAEGMNAIGPGGEVENYLWAFEKKPINISSAKVSTIKNPEHGVFERRGGMMIYVPKPDYIGPDRATFLVEAGGLKIKVEYFIEVVDDVAEEMYEDPEYCPNGPAWRISLNPDDSSSPVYTFSHPYAWQNPLTETIKASLTFADLPDGALGQSTGTTITLDDNAAGRGWFIDSTPWANEEWLPTHNPNEWVAKAGSAAAGKMDMLSVLLHEYGHALGIEHSADHSSYMATTLTPGVRRLPSSEELSLMAKLVGELKQELITSTASSAPGTNTPDGPAPFPWLPLDSTLGLAFLGRLRSRLSDASATGATTHAEPHFEVAANATLTNGGFGDSSGWSTQGRSKNGSVPLYTARKGY